MKYVYLALAIILEVVGSSFLKASNGFTKAVPVAVMIVAYVASFYCLSQALKHFPLGMVYAIWSGIGIVLTAVVGLIVFKQSLDTPAILGIVLIIAGVVVMNVLSKTSTH